MRDLLTGHIFSHTHWDRAWYWTAEQTRVRLVALVDELLEILDSDADYRHFTLDGQMAMVDDYLQLRPEQTELVSALVRAGRLLVGPLYVLPDLFIPDGESLIRNLQLGRRLAQRLGKPMSVAYIPDPFGYPEQLPQVLAGFGLDGFVFARGMGDEGEQLGADFWWEAPDGSRVLATHQEIVGGYAALAELGAGEGDPADLALQQVDRLVDQVASQCPHGQLLLGNGRDHLHPQADLAALIAFVNRRRKGSLELRHSNLPAYQEAVSREIAKGAFSPRTFRGELRGSRYTPILSGTLSARVDLKQRHDACERLLLRWVEPFGALAALFGAGSELSEASTTALVERAWRRLLLCQPHDDICGCSIDRVHDDDLNRMRRCEEIGESLLSRHFESLVPPDVEAAAFNPHPYRLRTVIDLPSEVRPPRGAISQHYRGSQRCLASLPALGVASVKAVAARRGQFRPVEVTSSQRGVTLDNGLIRVDVGAGGSIVLIDHRTNTRLERLLQVIDEGDAGDTYDYAPPANQQVVSTTPTDWRCVAKGPLTGAVSLRFEMQLPVGLSADRRARSRRCRRLDLTCTLEVSAASPVVELGITLRNNVDDHRLRLAFSAPPSDSVVAGSPFALTRRSLNQQRKKKGWVQPPATTAPFQSFLAVTDGCHGLAVIAPGLREYEARAEDQATTLMLTLLRSVRWLSRDDLSTRAGHAGPDFAVQGARHQGQTLRYRVGLLPFGGDLANSNALAHARLFADPPRVIRRQQDGATARPEGPLQVEALRVRPLSVFCSSLANNGDGSVCLRLVNPWPHPIAATIDGGWTGRRARLDGQKQGRLLNLKNVRLEAHEVATINARPLHRKA